MIEILIVAAIISIFAGLAIFGAQRMYDDNRRKAMFDETSQIGRGLSFAEQDLGFHPRIYLLGLPITEIVVPGTPGAPAGLDTYGQVLVGSSQVANVARKWTSPYMGFSETRKSLSQGSRGLKKMYIPEIDRLVEWPCDTWGNPYMLYEVVSFIDGGSTQLRFAQPGEGGDFLTAVVSYGPNGIPGNFMPNVDDGSLNSETSLIRRSGMPFFISDPSGSPLTHFTDLENREGSINPMQYTLRPYSGSDGLEANADNILNRVKVNYNSGGTAPINGYLGILDDGTDDIIWRF